jgi:hypothetical protein
MTKRNLKNKEEDEGGGEIQIWTHETYIITYRLVI